MNEFPLVTLVTLAALTMSWRLAAKVGAARVASPNPHSPEIYSQPEFMRVFRNHANFNENLLLFLPALWLFALSYSDSLAALIGTSFLVGRIMYARNYPANHRLGFQVAYFSCLILFAGIAIKTCFILATRYAL